MSRYTIDRFEGDFAVLLLRQDESIQIDVSKSELPPNANEGDILEIEYDSNDIISNMKILKDETLSAKKKVEGLLKKLVDKNKK